MAILNITYNGLSVDYKVAIDARMNDRDIRRTAAELIRSGDLPGLQIAALPDNAFDHYVVDRLHTARGAEAAGTRIYLRPKVPFG